MLLGKCSGRRSVGSSMDRDMTSSSSSILWEEALEEVRRATEKARRWVLSPGSDRLSCGQQHRTGSSTLKYDMGVAAINYKSTF